MKTIPALLATQYADKARTIALCLKITRADAAVLGFTDAGQDVIHSGTTYKTAPNANLQAIASAADFSVGSTEAQTLLDSEGFTTADLVSGKWDGASWELIRLNWRSVSDGVEVLKAGTLGNVSRRTGQFSVELLSFAQKLQNTVGAVTTPTCRWRLGDANCAIVLAGYTVTGTFTSSASQYAATDTARAEAAEYFTEGVLTITSGANAGLSQKVKAFTTGAFTFSLPFPFVISAGVTYSVHAGCRKRLAEDCAAKFSNARRFGGEPHLPGVDKLARPPEYSA